MEDRTIKAGDKANLKGYTRKWQDRKMLFGCGLFNDLLQAAAILYKALQADEMCVVTAIEAVLKRKAK
jgi:hypothetical protein